MSRMSKSSQNNLLYELNFYLTDLIDFFGYLEFKKQFREIAFNVPIGDGVRNRRLAGIEVLILYSEGKTFKECGKIMGFCSTGARDCLLILSELLRKFHRKTRDYFFHDMPVEDYVADNFIIDERCFFSGKFLEKIINGRKLIEEKQMHQISLVRLEKLKLKKMVSK